MNSIKTSIRFYNDRKVVPSTSSTTEMKTNSTTAPSVPELVEGSEGTIVEHFETSRKK